MLVQYSLSFDPATDPSRLLDQLRTSLWSLRRHNTRVPAVVLVHDEPPAGLPEICRTYGADLLEMGSYAARLASLCPEGWPVLAANPTLHKFLSHGALGPVDRVLCCDADTLFAGDVEDLAARYTEADVYAREEVHTGPSRYGPDRDFLDLPALLRLVHGLGVHAIPPFNTGVVLLNHGRSTHLAALHEWFVRCVWHLVVWMSLTPAHTAGSGYGTLERVEAAHLLASGEQRARALPYPSANQWIVEEVATWLSLGALPGLTTGFLSPAHVAQNGELADPGATPVDRWLLCHYFSTDTRTALGWLAHRSTPTAVLMPMHTRS
ncbi:hypothetical protein GCM10011509_16540 [Ornithinimicrobium pekingense]|uniref:Uncharacterized protein n=2 Tax=Ornithinimicrobium pekingense TaxID=384677 RepID=A0ABQ2F7F7_9MICO|nr:hypothetical protein GCM10011509_16540 [Ornithinimicrobium pekingense]